MDSKRIDNTIQLLKADAQSRLRFTDEALGKLIAFCPGLPIAWNHAVDIPVDNLDKYIPESNPHRQFLLQGFHYAYNQASTASKFLAVLDELQHHDANGSHVTATSTPGGDGSAPQHHPNKSGGRNMFESSFALSGAQTDDKEGFKKSTRVSKPPGGESHGLW